MPFLNLYFNYTIFRSHAHYYSTANNTMYHPSYDPPQAEVKVYQNGAHRGISHHHYHRRQHTYYDCYPYEGSSMYYHSSHHHYSSHPQPIFYEEKGGTTYFHQVPQQMPSPTHSIDSCGSSNGSSGSWSPPQGSPSPVHFWHCMQELGNENKENGNF